MTTTAASHIEIYNEQLQAAEDAMQDARYSGDTQAFSYAEQRAFRLRRELAKLDPRGVGQRFLDSLSEAERNAALAS